MNSVLSNFKNEILEELTGNILPFWMNNMVDIENGGFYGRISGDGQVFKNADKGAILNCRILWAFSAAYRVLHNADYLNIATRAKNYIVDYFIDKKQGGVYWSLDSKGNPTEMKKQIYALGFAIYGLSEYFKVTKDNEALNLAQELFFEIEKHAFDVEKGGYFEAFTREWNDIEDMRLSAKDANERKTMNTHLHILEPYTNLYSVWKNSLLENQIRKLIDDFLFRIVDQKTFHLNLFFKDDWSVAGNIISYGHDIEASWLIYEAAMVLDDQSIIDKVNTSIRKIANASAEGIQPDGSLIYEKNVETNHIDFDRHSWVQAENVVGFFNIYQHFKEIDALQKSINSWNFIKSDMVDKQNGEWFWSIKADGTANVVDDKAGFWKCPYHNTRMCLEIIERTNTLLK